MAPPVTGDGNFSEHVSDQDHNHNHNHQTEDNHHMQLIMKSELGSSTLVPDDSPIAQFSKPRSSPPPSPAPAPAPAPAPFTPSPSYSGKRRGRKPKAVRSDGFPATKKKRGSKTVAHDPSRKCSSILKEKTATKGLGKRVTWAPSLNGKQVTSVPSWIQAREIQSSLGNEHPSFIKLMVKSHVASCFWLGLPLPFCKSSLPNEDTTLVLEDESGEKCDVKYIEHRGGLSGGWRKFALDHNLLEGDALVFHLVESYKFKVYIIREKDLKKEAGGALSPLNLEAATEQITQGRKRKVVSSSPTMKRGKRQKPLPSTLAKKQQKKSTLSSRTLRSPRHGSNPMEPSRNDSEDVGLETTAGSRISSSVLSFEKVKNFEDFRIKVNGMCIDSELVDDVRMKYYKLCLLNQEFLHSDVAQGLNCKLVAGMIGQTVSISDEIKKCKMTTAPEQFETWENSLKSFELLGMKVGFLREKVQTLMQIVSEAQGVVDVKRYMDAKKEQRNTEEEIRKSEAKLVELKETSRQLSVVVDTLKEKADQYVAKFQEEVNALW